MMNSTREKLTAAARQGVWTEEWPEMSGCANRRVVSTEVVVRGVEWLLILWADSEGREIRAIRTRDAWRVAAWDAPTRRGRRWIEAAWEHATPLDEA